MNLSRLIFAGGPPAEVEVVNLEQDQALKELAARNAERAQAAIKSLGHRWVLHPANAPKRREAA